MKSNDMGFTGGSKKWREFKDIPLVPTRVTRVFARVFLLVAFWVTRQVIVVSTSRLPDCILPIRHLHSRKNTLLPHGHAAIFDALQEKNNKKQHGTLVTPTGNRFESAKLYRRTAGPRSTGQERLPRRPSWQMHDTFEPALRNERAELCADTA